jgi:hypothetical protein
MKETTFQFPTDELLDSMNDFHRCLDALRGIVVSLRDRGISIEALEFHPDRDSARDVMLIMLRLCWGTVSAARDYFELAVDHFLLRGCPKGELPAWQEIRDGEAEVLALQGTLSRLVSENFCQPHFNLRNFLGAGHS